MDAARISEILKTEYGINSRAEFDAAVSEMKGIDIGIFTTPLFERREASERRNETMAIA